MRCERCDGELERPDEAWAVELRSPDGSEKDRLCLCEKCARTVFGNAARAAFRVRDRKKGVVE